VIRLARSLRSDDNGAAIIELALVAPVLALMTIGTVDMANAFGCKLRLEQAAQRSIEKVMQTTGELSVEGTITQEALCQYNGVNEDGECNDAPITEDNVTVTHRLECNGVEKIVTETDTDCAEGETESRWIQVRVWDDYAPLFPVHFSGIDAGNKYRIEALAGMRTE